ncbi:uncharacterized protein LOC135687420 [Rhopilema esculentum]|uniref:uncharacterized protein LOC135687420 n=1 Tax=Rhopilema esculentum TaxID=499914 RepID=UPI0031CE24B8
MSVNIGDVDMAPLLEYLGQQNFDMRIDDDHIPYAFRCEGVSIVYEGLKAEYLKVHKKIPKAKQQQAGLGDRGSWMRVKDSHVDIFIENKSRPGVPIVKVVVQREKTAFAEARQMNDGDKKIVRGEVTIPYECKAISASSWRLSLDLDTVYMASEGGVNKEVYALCPSNIEKTNKFQLVTEVYVRQVDEFGKQVDMLIGKKESKPFLLRTEPRHPPANKTGAITNGGYSPSSSSEASPEQVDLPDGSFNNLRANTADFHTLSAQVVSSSNRDIGYHIPLKDLSQKGKLKEGDVVVFLDDESNRTKIEKMNESNYKNAKLAGVITRSYYLEGRCPEADKGETDLVCIIGIVKVRVVGPVYNGEQLYAYPERHGVAATRSTISLDRSDVSQRLLLLGQALESKPDTGIQEEALVSSLISVVNGIDSLAMTQKVSDLHVKIDDTIKRTMANTTKKLKRHMFWVKLLFLLILATVGIALWQRYAPNTLFRNSACKKGSLDEKTMVLSFNTSWEKVSITALEFTFESLKTKVYNSDDLHPRKEKGMRYFINYKRCCNRGVSYGNKYVDDTVTVAGPEVLSSDQACKPESVKYLNDGQWVRLQNAKRKVLIDNCNSSL